MIIQIMSTPSRICTAPNKALNRTPSAPVSFNVGKKSRKSMMKEKIDVNRTMEGTPISRKLIHSLCIGIARC